MPPKKPVDTDTVDTVDTDDYPAAVTYVGEFDRVSVTRPDGTRGTVKHGEAFKTTDEHAEALRDQPTNWT